MLKLEDQISNWKFKQAELVLGLEMSTIKLEENLLAGNHAERQAGNSAVTPGQSERSIWGCSVSRELETLHQYQMNENGDQRLRGLSEMKGLKARLVFLAKA